MPPETYTAFCRNCHVPLRVVVDETGDSECPSCGVFFVGNELAAIVEYEVKRRLLEKDAKRLRRNPGQPVKPRAMPANVRHDIRNLVLVLKEPSPSRKGPN